MLAALEESLGWDPRRADVIVGTSAGSITGATLRAGLSAADPAFRDSSSLAVLLFQGAGRGAASRLTLDAAEEQEVALASRNAARAASPASMPPPNAPVRVGGNIKAPAKILDVRPVYPKEAMAARVTGLVVLEVIVGADGAVADAHGVTAGFACYAATADALAVHCTRAPRPARAVATSGAETTIGQYLATEPGS